MIGIHQGIPGSSRRLAAWTPWESLGGQWFDAADGMSGSPVSAWTARLSAATATQGTVANQPAAPVANVSLGNELASAFDGAGDLLVSGTALALPTFTFAAVLKTGTLKNYVGLFRLAPTETTGGAGSWCLYAKADGAIEYGSGALGWFRSSSSTGVLASGTAYALILTCDGTSGGTVLQKGVISGGSITWSTVSFGAVIGSFAAPSGTNYLQPGGSFNTAATSRFVGDLALYGGRPGVITAGEETSLKSYLAGRFAV